ncbi:hypothetical protein [Nonomuraea typhae]|uniref:hypothetical protein n=1 Tax=Nonomuraea typhae TaxID=2603600 RepID=UPI0012FA73EE|nr:hypothetical protein [Nonomuraea typhae]
MPTKRSRYRDIRKGADHGQTHRKTARVTSGASGIGRATALAAQAAIPAVRRAGGSIITRGSIASVDAEEGSAY